MKIYYLIGSYRNTADGLRSSDKRQGPAAIAYEGGNYMRLYLSKSYDAFRPLYQAIMWERISINASVICA